MEKPLSLWKKIIFLAIPYLIFVGILGTVEGWTRIKNPPISSLELFTRRNFDHKVKLQHGRQVFEGDPLLGWRLMPNLSMANWDFTTFSTNERGWRYSGDVGKKEKDAVRIVVLGDSVVFGFRVPMAWTDKPLEFDKNQKPFPALMEDRLRQLNPGRKIEVIPMAVPGYSSYQGRRWLERDIEKLKPDLVLVHFGWNDTERQVQSDRQALPQSWWRVTQRKIISKSQLLAYLVRKKGEAVLLTSLALEGQPELQPRVSKTEYVANIMAIAALAEKYRAKTLVLGQVYRGDTVTNVEQQSRIAEYRQSLAVAMRRAGIPYLEIEKLTEKGYPENNTFFGEAIHPNHLGHLLMAQEILAFIKKENLLNLIF